MRGAPADLRATRSAAEELLGTGDVERLLGRDTRQAVPYITLNFPTVRRGAGGPLLSAPGFGEVDG